MTAPKQRKRNYSTTDDLKRCVEAGMTTREAAELTGRTAHGVARWARLHGLKFAPAVRAKVADEALMRAMAAEGLTYREAMVRSGHGLHMLRRSCEVYGVELVKTKDAPPPQAQQVRGNIRSRKTRYNRNYNARHPEKRAAHKAVERAMERGEMIPSPCEQCGDEKSQAHHHDYSKPLDVTWLCYSCHMAHHRPAVEGLYSREVR